MKRERLMLVILVVVVPLMFAASLSYFGPPALAYLGQDSPTMTLKIFAPGVISQKDVSEFGSVFNQEGTELFYGVDLQGRSEIRYTYLKNGEWTKGHNKDPNFLPKKDAPMTRGTVIDGPQSQLHPTAK